MKKPVPRSRPKRLLFLSLVVLVAGTGFISWRVTRNRWRDAVLLRDYNQVISGRGIVILEQPILTFKGHTRRVSRVAFSPDGTRIASAGGDGDATVKIWNSQTAELLLTLSGHDRGVYNLAFSPDGKIIASAGHDHTLRLWNAHTGKILRMIDGLEIHVVGVAFSPDGARIATGDGNGAKVWQVETGQEALTLQGQHCATPTVAFSPDGKLLAGGRWDWTVKVWNAASGQELLTFHRVIIETFGVSSSARIASGSLPAAWIIARKFGRSPPARRLLLSRAMSRRSRC